MENNSANIEKGLSRREFVKRSSLATAGGLYLGSLPNEFSWDMEPPVKPGSDGSYPAAVPGETEPY